MMARDLAKEQFPPGQEIMRARDRSSERKTALIVDHYVPQPDQDAGSRTRAAIIECLLHAGYVVKFWPDNLVYDHGYTEALQRLGIEVFYGTTFIFSGSACRRPEQATPNCSSAA